MFSSSFRAQIYFPTFNPFNISPKFPRFIPINAVSSPRFPSPSSSASSSSAPLKQSPELSPEAPDLRPIPAGNSRLLIAGAVSVGVFLLLTACDGGTALALGPEGPLVEEFWENVRRYALYALTVSTGAVYTIFQPMFELLKNPISAVLLLAILGGGIFIVSQVLSAMVGVSEFSYDYGY